MFGPVLGLDIGASAVKLCQLTGEGKSLCLSRLGLVPLPLGAVIDGEVIKREPLVEALGEAVRKAGGWQRKVALALSSSKSVLVRQITIPLMTDQELAEQIHWEAEQQIPFSLDEVNLDYQVIGRRPEAGTMEILLVAARKDRVEALVEVARAAGLRPVSCDVASAARARLLLHRRGLHLGETVALIDVGASQTTVDLLDEGRSVGHTTVTAGGESVTRMIAERLALSFREAEALKLGEPTRATSPYRGAEPSEIVAACLEAGAEAIGEEIQRVLGLLSERVLPRRLEGVYLTGGAACHEALRRTLARLIRVRVELWTPAADLPTAPRVDIALRSRAALRLSLALGLALGDRAAAPS